MQRIFVILESIAYNDVHTIDEISSVTKIPRSSVHRILQSLVQENLITQVPPKGYVLTAKLVSIGINGIGQKNIVEVAVPIMKELSQKTHETVSLQVINGAERVCLCRFEGDYPITRHIKPGDKGVLFRGAAGKIIAAGLRSVELETILDKYIEDGIILGDKKSALLTEIQQIREAGFAISTGERVPGSGSIGVPIKDILNNTQASLSISTVLDRMTEENIQTYLKLLINSSAQIQSQVIW
ncbi:MAG: IclR family transcriptional regulator [Treponema sp.]|jgi:DNA-binding IclR family transcriptional regulator|nr:IclR family transcriptional regulator [Treponema sp.]